jgi:hypothetical protein
MNLFYLSKQPSFGKKCQPWLQLTNEKHEAYKVVELLEFLRGPQLRIIEIAITIIPSIGHIMGL